MHPHNPVTHIISQLFLWILLLLWDIVPFLPYEPQHICGLVSVLLKAMLGGLGTRRKKWGENPGGMHVLLRKSLCIVLKKNGGMCH